MATFMSYQELTQLLQEVINQIPMFMTLHLVSKHVHEPVGILELARIILM